MLSLFTELLLSISGTRLAVFAVFCVFLGAHSHLVSQRLRVILAELIEGWRQAHQDDAANHLQSGRVRENDQGSCGDMWGTCGIHMDIDIWQCSLHERDKGVMIGDLPG